RNMVPPAPTCDPHGAKRKKRKINSEEESSIKAKKAKVEKKSTADVVIEPSEVRTKKKHDQNVTKVDSETETDEETLAERLKQKQNSAKKHQKLSSKGKSSESIIKDTSEAQVDPELGYSIPLSTIKPDRINISSSPDSEELTELITEVDEIIQEGDAIHGRSSKPELFDQHHNKQNNSSLLETFEKHLSPDPLNNQTLFKEQPQKEPSIETQIQPEEQNQSQQQQPENMETDLPNPNAPISDQP
ncbi:hypothetical protein A2U01_0019581, partial [Trifolium medium]|nr:hypothetical protein [Trifolium medium]